MSDIHRRIVTLFEARGAGQMRAQLGMMRSGMGGFRRDLRDTRTEMSMLDRQWRAFGTTTRYALAGGAIFGGISLVSQINQIQQQLGLVSAISPTAFNNVALVGEQLEKFGEQAEDAALRANVPITEFNAGLVNLVSTVQNVPENQVIPMLEQIAQTAKLSMTPVDEATKGITGLMVAFDEAPTHRNVQRFLAEYQRLIFTVPGGAAAGPQIIQQLPQLAAVSRLAAVNPEQMFGLLNSVLRAGGSPATSARGLQYLIQGLAQPPSDEARKALAGIGITPQVVQQEGGVRALFRLIQEVRKRGVGGNVGGLAGLNEETLSLLEGTGGNIADLGITGEGAQFARTAVGRIHGVRSLVLLAAQEEQVSEDLRTMARLGANHEMQVNELRTAWQRYEDKAQLQKVGLAINQMALDVAQVFEPLLNFAGRGVIAAQSLVDDRAEEATAALVGGAGALALSRRLRRRMGGLRGLGVAHAAYSTATSIGDPNAERGSNPTNPVFVAIAYSLAGWGRNASMVPGPGPVPGGGNRPVGRWGRALRGLGWVGLGASGALAANEVYRGLDPFGFQQRNQRAAQRGTPFFDFLTRKTGGFSLPVGGLFGSALTFGEKSRKLTPAQQKIIDRVDKGFLSEVNAERMLRRISTMEQLREAGIKVKGQAEITVNVNQPGARPTRSKVILDFVPDFAPSAPQQRGQGTTRRGG